MARPTEIPDFATGASRRLEPDAGEKSNGFREGYRFPPRKANWAVGLSAAWARYLSEIINSAHEHVYPTPKTRTFLVSLWTAFSRRTGASAEEWVWPADPLADHWLESNGSHVVLVVPLPMVRDGMTINEVKVLCAPSTGEAATADRMQVSLASILPQFGTPAAPTPTVHETTPGQSASSGIQVITLTVDPEVAAVTLGSNLAREYYLVITSSVAVSGDRVYAIQVTGTDPGPRNF